MEEDKQRMKRQDKQESVIDMFISAADKKTA